MEVEDDAPQAVKVWDKHNDGVFFFNDTATTEIYTLSLHDALPIFLLDDPQVRGLWLHARSLTLKGHRDRKSTRLNSSHQIISYAVFCLQKLQTPLGEEDDTTLGDFVEDHDAEAPVAT